MGLSEYALKLQTSLEDAALVPGSASPLIPRDFNPTTELHIAYDDREVDFGNLFRARECKMAPTVTFQPEVRNSSKDPPLSPCPSRQVQRRKRA